MSEFTTHNPKRQKQVLDFCQRILKGDKPVEAIKQNQKLIETINYRDVIWVTDQMMNQNIPMEKLKMGVNKFLNVFYTSLNDAKLAELEENSFLYFLEENNLKMEAMLNEMKPLIKQINKTPKDEKLINQLHEQFEALLTFESHYVIKENILFPALEKHWEDYRCVKIMWSFHDDIRRNLKELVQLLSLDNFDIDDFNPLVGDLFFDMLAIRFRERKIIFPYFMESIPAEEHLQMLEESLDFNWPFVKPEKLNLKSALKASELQTGEIDLGTGRLVPEQVRLMMNHLPVDVTFVDEHNKVCYFSEPKKRIFPRTKAIIGRDVQNCHPHESVHVVEKIVEAFRKGEKDHADFWIHMMGDYILIQYFAIRNEAGEYKGVVEVTQEISGIQAIKGDKRLLDWE